MPAKSQRLFVRSRLGHDRDIGLDPPQAHYLINVLRCKTGDDVLLFNGEDGEWRGRFSAATKKRANVALEEQTRPQIQGPDLHYLFAPLKRARLDYMAQKATEMGASLLKPVITRRTVAERVNRGRLAANAIEAAEQCGILWVPEVAERETLPRFSKLGTPAGSLSLPMKLRLMPRRLWRFPANVRAPLPCWLGPRADLPRRRGRCSSSSPLSCRSRSGPD